MQEHFTTQNNHTWIWKEFEVAWNYVGSREHSSQALLLIHGFGGCKEHWRHNQPILGQHTVCYAIDLIGFGKSSQPNARLIGEHAQDGDFTYKFDNWAAQIADFCHEIVEKPVILIGNSIGGVIALRAAQLLEERCNSLILIDCAQRTMDDKRIIEQPLLMRWFRPYLKTLVKQRWLSSNLFRNASNPYVIQKILSRAYPSGKNVDNNLVELLLKPSKRTGAKEAFRGFINLFNDYLAPQLMEDMKTPVDLIWGEKDPWEPIEEAQKWLKSYSCIRSLDIVPCAGHCPHDEFPEYVNSLLLKLIQQAA